MNPPSNMGKSPQLELLVECLRRLLGREDEALAAALLPWLGWRHIAGGEMLFRKDDAGDSVFLVVSGRLRHVVAVGDPAAPAEAEITRGEAIGATEFLAGGTRPFGVVAIRDSVLAVLSRNDYESIVRREPDVSLTLTALLLAPLRKRSGAGAGSTRPVNICLLPITQGVDAADIGYALARSLSLGARVLVVSRDTLRDHHGSHIADHELSTDQYRQLTGWLDEVESGHEFLIFIADPVVSEWTRRCVRESDEVVLLARADMPGQGMERELADIESAGTGRRTLVLLHDAATRIPLGTRAWLEHREVADCLHVRPTVERDIARLARILSGTATGLVLSGGGARGFAHLGVVKALEEFGVEIDTIGGASIGAIMGAYCAFDLPADDIIEQARAAFARGPTRDINLLPLISLVGGRRLKAVIDDAVINATGHRIDIEDTWKSLFCVASNYTRAAETVVTRGDLAKWLRTCVSIPGVLPLVPHQGELMGDGGTFNNFPTDIMRRRGVGYVIGIDLLQRGFPRLDIDEVPGTWQLWRDRLRLGSKRRYRMPSLTSTLVSATMLASQARQREARQRADLCFTPEMKGIGMLDWGKFDAIVEFGYRHARAILWNLPESEAARLQGGQAAPDWPATGSEDWDDAFIVP